MDFFQIKEREVKKGVLEVYPDFKIVRSKDLMIRGKSFYGIWDEGTGLWSTDEFDVQRLVDVELARHEIYTVGVFEITRKYLGNFSSNSWLQFRNYMSHLTDNSHQLDENLTFANTPVTKNNYASRRLDYSLEAGSIAAWDELVSFLYAPDERAKIEWAIGAIVAGDSKTIQKFLVFYGDPGTGKGTILNIIEKLFKGYVEFFEASALTSANNQFGLEAFKSNPLVAINHDGDLSKIVDNSKLNSVIAHEPMTFNEKHKPTYTSRVNAFCMIGTNKAVKITDAKSGLIRRTIDIHPTGALLRPRMYQALYSQIDFELGAIANHCLEVYRTMGKNYYEGYKPIDMMLQTDVYYNFVEEYYDVFREQDGTTLKQAYDLYKQYAKDSSLEFIIPQFKFREELKNYFETFEERPLVNGVRVRSWFSGFKIEKFGIQAQNNEHALPLVLDEVESLFDTQFASTPAQYANAHETPSQKWSDVTTVLSDLNTRDLHYVNLGENDIVIDFDLKDDNGEKSAELNIAAAALWPPTYTEFSKSTAGVHLHYYYDGDTSELSRIHSDGIEVKVFTGDSSLRRQLSKCNNVPIATITRNSGLKMKEKKVVNTNVLKSERGLREQIKRNLNKEIHSGTKPSMDFIHHILEEAYMSGLQYDVTDMRNKIMAFGNNSTHNSIYCLKLMQKMRFHSDPVDDNEGPDFPPADGSLAFFDVEVFPNLFVVCWKLEDKIDAFGQKIEQPVIKMINPSAQAIEELMALKLVGFNCRRYDNHILYAAYMGYNNEQLYTLSQKMIAGVKNAHFGEAYGISYADIYDYTALKQSLKKYQIQLGLNHKELGLPWDQPVPDDMIDSVVEYCANDVITTEQVHNARIQDFVARQILADLSGLPVNSTTQQHTAKIVFGDDKRPQEKFKYTDLSEEFPGYEFKLGKSTYRGEITGEGGYIYAEPGMYENVALLDVASMHPRSIEMLDLFGEYTENFSALKAARIAIKRKDYDAARKMLGGKLARHLENPEEAEALSYALKIVINIVYGMTSAKFDNSFRDPRNIDNIVAKRGALFMVELKHAVQNFVGRGGERFSVAHIKTDSIKIPNATPEIIDFVIEFGEKYGYEFEHEDTFEKMCLVNDAVYIAYVKEKVKDDGKVVPAHWSATGAEFQKPYVFKKLFSHEPIEFSDLCETKTVQTALYLDMTPEDTAMALEERQLHFVGKAGSFVPIMPGHGGGLLLREKDGEYASASGAKGYRWVEAEMVEPLGLMEYIDMSYYNKMLDSAIDTINKFGDFERFAA